VLAGLSHLLESRAPDTAAKPGFVRVVAAHPDDEAIGAGAHLSALHDPWALYVTTGAPQNPAFAARAGFKSPDEYAGARKEEAFEALALAEISPSRIRAYASDALEEIVEEGVTGFLVSDEQGMAQAIRAVPMIDPLRCRRAALERFSAERMICRYIELYSALRAGCINRARGMPQSA
jgi:glycosyltransferase involved in cell wall biosynthesis